MEKYRADIDGLRALAVGAVVLYHFGFPFVAGGFVGVDVFFVISGYLITGIITEEVRAGTFRYSAFYERRVRRIVPAATVMIGATLLVGVLFLMPAELDDLARSAGSALVSLSNVYFWTQAGYFDVSAEARPLLHTWSLAVEEQFYLLYPVFIGLMVRWAPRHLARGVGAMTVGSFVACVLATQWAPSSAFYLAPFRAWELGLGALVRCGGIWMPGSRGAREALAGGGLVAIVAAIVAMAPADPFPGWRALVPCLGTAAVILAGRAGPTLAGKALTLRPIVFVGLISYSWYLWHWPLRVFDQLLNPLGRGPGFIDRAPLLLAGSFALAVLSWRLVERPFRDRARWGARRAISVAGGGTAVLAGAAIVIVGLRGLPARFPPEAVRLAAYLQYDEAAAFRSGTCFLTSRDARGALADECLRARPGQPSVLVLGDSHAAQLWYGLDRAMPGHAILQATASGCKPTMRHAATEDRRCARLIARVYGDIEQLRPDVILLAGRWREGSLPFLPESLSALKRSGARVILLGPELEYDTPLPRLLAAAVVAGDRSLPAGHLSQVTGAMEPRLSAIASRAGVEFLSLTPALCPQAECMTVTGSGVPVQFDAVGHLTREGSVLVGAYLAQAILAARRP